MRNCLKREACIKRASGRWKCVSQQHIELIFIFRSFNRLSGSAAVQMLLHPVGCEAHEVVSARHSHGTSLRNHQQIWAQFSFLSLYPNIFVEKHNDNSKQHPRNGTCSEVSTILFFCQAGYLTSFVRKYHIVQQD